MKHNLFILNRHLRSPLFAVRKLCCEISDLQMFKFDLRNPSKLYEFVKNQSKYRVQLSKKLNGIYSQIKDQTLQACEIRLHAHLVENGFRDKNSTPDQHRFKLFLHDDPNENENEDDETKSQMSQKQSITPTHTSTIDKNVSPPGNIKLRAL